MAVTHIDEVATGSNLAAYTGTHGSGIGTPADDSLCILTISVTASSGVEPPDVSSITDAASWGVTWELIDGPYYWDTSGTTFKFVVYAALFPGTGYSSGHFTVNLDGTAAGAAIILDCIDGLSGGASAADYFKQFATNNGAAATGGSATLAALQDASNIAWSNGLHQVNENATQGGAFTLVDSRHHTTPAETNATEYAVGETVCDWTWASSSDWFVWAAEIAIDASAGGGVSGDGDEVLPAITAAADGGVLVSGDGAEDLPALGASGSGTIDVSGDGAEDLPAIAASGDGTVLVTADGSETLPPLGTAGDGTVLVSGDGAEDLPSLGSAGDGTVLVTGDGAEDLPALTISGEGSVLAAGALIGGEDLPALVAEGTAALTVTAFPGVETLPALSASGSALTAPTGQGTVTLPDLVADGAGALGAAPSGPGRDGWIVWRYTNNPARYRRQFRRPL